MVETVAPTSICSVSFYLTLTLAAASVYGEKMIKAKYSDQKLFKKAAAACYELAHLGVLIDMDVTAQEIILRGSCKKGG